MQGAFSPRLVESIVRLSTWMPFERVPAALEFFTEVTVDEDTARRVTERAGAALAAVEAAEVERLERELPAPASGPDLQQMSADGAMVPLVGGEWAEVKTLVLGTVQRVVGTNGLPEPRTSELSYCSRLADAQSFGRCALLETHRRGTATAGTVCAVMDGAEWLQSFVDLHRPDAVRILDFPHAVEHLSAAAHAAFGPGSQAASEWLGVQLHELKHGDPDRVLAALRVLPASAALDPAEALATRDRVVSYLEKRRTQLAYAQFCVQGYPIGSGIVESANKLVVEARLKGSGMHWARPNVDSMLVLRAAACSDRWDASWPQLWQQLRRQATERRRQRRAMRPASARPPEPEASPAPPAPAEPPPADPPRERLVVDGRPTANHPWRKPFLRRATSPASAKI